MVGSDDGLDGRLEALNPLPDGIVHTQASSAALDEIRLRARSGPRDRVSPSRWRVSTLIPHTRRGVAALSAFGLLAAGTAAAATKLIISTYTGQTDPPSQVQAFGAGQLLRVGGAGYCDEVKRLGAGLTYPSGYQSWSDYALVSNGWTGVTVSQLCSSTTPYQLNNNGKTDDLMTTQGQVSATWASSAFCAWTDNWVRAELSGDTATASTDAAEIAGALQWPATKLGDPDPRNDIPDVGGGTTETRLGWIPAVQQAVASGDVALVRQAFNYYADQSQSGWVGASCWNSRPPANSDNGTYLAPPTMTPPTGDGF
jgi:hypothetical protein